MLKFKRVTPKKQSDYDDLQSLVTPKKQRDFEDPQSLLDGKFYFCDTYCRAYLPSKHRRVFDQLTSNETNGKSRRTRSTITENGTLVLAGNQLSRNKARR